jgi:STE24 endopeptidase
MEVNIYLIILLTTVIAGFLLNITADILNLRHLSPLIPKRFEGVYDSETYKKSQEYTRVNTHFGFITSSFDLLLLLIFWFSDGFNWLDISIRQYFQSEITRGLAYISILVFANSILHLPFNIYSTFVIEEKFGFNKTSVKTFLGDLLKSTALTVVIGLPVIALIIYIIQNTGDWAFAAAWLIVVIISLVITYIAPAIILPLFNKFKPLEEGELRKSIFDFATKVKFPLSNIFVMDGSKRSTKSNAFFTGFGKNKRIALFDTLIAKHTIKELLAVLAHEIGHYKKKHILTGTITQYMKMGVLFFLMMIFISEKGLSDAFFMDNMSIYTGLIFFGMLYSPIEIIFSLLTNIGSRRHEYEADRFAVENFSSGKDMISALKKLSKDNLSNLTPHTFYVFLYYSHPPVLKRIEAIEKIAKNYSNTLEEGE